MENMTLYNAVRACPAEAQKTIGAGRLKGMTDINPMWRIQALTEQFGPCGVGWKYEIADKRLEPASTGEMAAFLDIRLYIKWEGAWSEPIPGTGGSAFVANERSGLHVSDECFKMALTDAISVAAKALGFGADVYWKAGASKYDRPTAPPAAVCPVCGREQKPVQKNGKTISGQQVIENCGNMCVACYRERRAADESQAG